MEQQGYPEGHYTGIGIAVGIPLGMASGLAMGNIAVGSGIGVALGLSIGTALERKYNPNPRTLTSEERRVRNRNLLVALVLGVIVLIAGIAVFFLKQ